jgi:hydroxymethylpyrimidine pyrophosphatase-like HAD family hydrolase
MSYTSLIFDPTPELAQKMSRVRFVVMDVDGTITSPNDSTAINVSQTLGRLDKADIKWSFATGRSIAGLHSTASAIFGRRLSRRLPPAICYNGAVTFVPGTPSVLSIRTMNVIDVLRTLALGKELGLSAILYSCISHLGSPVETVYALARPLPRPQTDINAMPIVYVDDWQDVDLTGTVAILFEVPAGPSDSDVRRLQEAAGSSVQVTASGGPFLEVTRAAISKGEALIWLLDEIRSLGARYVSWRRFGHLDLSTTMVIGDNFNDVGMLTVAGIAVAVANAPDKVKQVADMVCTLPAGQGAVEAMKMMLDIRRYRSAYA